MADTAGDYGESAGTANQYDYSAGAATDQQVYEPDQQHQPEVLSPNEEEEYVPQAADYPPVVAPSSDEKAAPTEAEVAFANEMDEASNVLAGIVKPDAQMIDFQAEVEHPRSKQFSVTEPANVGGTTKYTVVGVDEDGDFKIMRRFKEFHALSTQMRTRWPGIYVPAMPEKKMMNAKDTEVVEERRALLEKFLKDCAKFDYIIFSKEFKIFSRGPGEVDKELMALPKQTPMQVLEKY